MLPKISPRITVTILLLCIPSGRRIKKSKSALHARMLGYEISLGVSCCTLIRKQAIRKVGKGLKRKKLLLEKYEICEGKIEPLLFALSLLSKYIIGALAFSAFCRGRTVLFICSVLHLSSVGLQRGNFTLPTRLLPQQGQGPETQKKWYVKSAN